MIGEILTTIQFFPESPLKTLDNPLLYLYS
jgi:hypothetical protein